MDLINARTLRELIINDNCFKNCTKLSEISFKNVEKVSFGQCASLKKFKLICSTQMAIFEKFKKTSLETVILSGRCISIKDDCFSEYSKLLVFSIIMARSIVIGKNQFLNCISLQKIIIEMNNDDDKLEAEAVIEFGPNCFDFTDNLKEILLSAENVKIVDQSINKIYCTGLKKKKKNIISYLK